MPTIALLGLGEAGSRLADDLVAAGVEVRGYDPDTELTRAPDAQAAVAGSDFLWPGATETSIYIGSAAMPSTGPFLPQKSPHTTRTRVPSSSVTSGISATLMS